MIADTIEADGRTPLRRQAELRLRAGTAPNARGAPTGAAALELLHRLASAPGSAADALKLLHELQVHQVELDLQRDQLDRNQTELSETLAHYVALFDFGPVAYLTIDTDGAVLDANIAAAELLGLERTALGGRRVDSFLTPNSRPVFLELRQRLTRKGSSESCEVQSDCTGSSTRRLQVVARVSADGRMLFMV